MFKVSYLHSAPSGTYRVSRAFDTREGAQEFIDANAMVCRLPGVRLILPESEALKLAGEIAKSATPDDLLSALFKIAIENRATALSSCGVKILRAAADLCGVESSELTKSQAITAIVENF